MTEQGSATAAWLERVVAEIGRGRHLIVHGNVRDPVRWQNTHVPLRQALTDILTRLEYQTVGYYDVVDGMSSNHDQTRDRDRLARLTAVRPVAPEPRSPSALQGGASGGNSRVAQGQTAITTRLRNAQAPAAAAYEGPDDALPAIRRALTQTDEAVAFVVDFAELLVADIDHADRADRRLVGMLKKAMLEAAQVGDLRNLLILVVHDLPALPEWLYQDEPFVQAVEAMRPGFDERREFLIDHADRFYEDPDGDIWDGDSVRVLANLTEGMAITELEGLWRTSNRELVGLAKPRELINRTLVGRRQDPWRQLADRVTGAEAQLARKVVGQPVATRRVSEALAAATLGIDFVADAYSLEARPKGVFFFVGPTGVGKTELAKALAELIYDDASALARFDMSSFAESHSAERFTGAPPGYVGYERGGELTNRVRQRPFSLLLFDEIEKAHPSIFDRFLQIIDDGRLTDGLGRTSYFAQTLIVFTSNLGAGQIYEEMRNRKEPPSYAEVMERFEDAVRRFFTDSDKLNRPELLGRFGNGIVPFDILRPDNLDLITRKFLDQLVRTAERTAFLNVDKDSVLALVRRTMADNPAELALGARRVRDTLDRAVRAPLVGRLVADGPRRYDRYDVFVPAGDDLARVVPSQA